MYGLSGSVNGMEAKAVMCELHFTTASPAEPQGQAEVEEVC